MTERRSMLPDGDSSRLALQAAVDVAPRGRLPQWGESARSAWPMLRRVGGYGALVALAGAGLAVAIGAAGHSSFLVPSGRRHYPAWMAGPFSGLTHGKMTGALFVLLLLSMCAAYGVAVVCSRGLHPGAAIAAIVGLQLVFLLAPPLLSTDIFSYVDYGRLGAVHGLNPYAHGAASAHADPAFPFTGHLWRHTRSVYGPPFTLLTYPLAALGVPAAMWGLKLIMALSSLGICALVWHCARERGLDPVRAAMLFGLKARRRAVRPRLADDRESAADVVEEAPRETARAILSAAAELSLPLRQALLLRDLQGLSYEEIARAQGVPVGTVRSRLSAARAAVVKRVSE